MFGNRLYAWNTMPMSRRFGGVRVSSRPPTKTAPPSGRSKPAPRGSAVVLPQPDGPSSGRNSPQASETGIPSSATEPPKTRRSSRSSTSAISVLLDDDGAPAARPSDDEQPQHCRPGDREAEQRERGRLVRPRLVDVVDVGREGREEREARDGELAHDDRER